MAALGWSMSAFTPIADINRWLQNVRFVPIADITNLIAPLCGSDRKPLTNPNYTSV